MNKYLSALIGLAAILAMGAAPAQARDYGNRSGGIQLGSGFGFAASPTGFALGFEGEYFATQGLSIVPKFTLMLPDGATVLTLTGDLRYRFDIAGSKEISRLKPFVNAGLGVAIALPDGPVGDEAAFMFEFGGGADYYVTNNFAVGTEMEFMIPVDLFNDNFIYQWQVVKARYLFE